MQTGPATLTLWAEAADHAAAFATNTFNLSARARTTTSVGWSPQPWPAVNARGPLQRTPNLAALVQEVIQRPGWQEGNAMAFLIAGAGVRTAESFDKPGGHPATLTVTFQTGQPAGTFARWTSGDPRLVEPGADPDGDGYDNLMEYALGLDPLRPDRQAVTLAYQGAQLVLTFPRAHAALDTTFQVEWCDDLSAALWSAAGVSLRIVADDGARQMFQAILPAGAAGRRFVRLKVTGQF